MYAIASTYNSRVFVVLALSALFVVSTAPAFADTLLSENFDTGSSDVPDISNWDEHEDGTIAKAPTSSGEDTASPNGGLFAKIASDSNDSGSTDGWICRSINAVGYTSIMLSYYWRGDAGANSSDDGLVQFKTSGSCSDTSGWTELRNHDLSSDAAWTTQAAFSVPISNSSFLLRFYNSSNASDEYFRVDGVSITGTPLVSDQTISVTTHAPASATYGSTFSVAATASSGLPVAITTDGGCSISGNTVTMTSGSTDCFVKYNQAGNASYNAAPEVTETVDAQKANATIDVSGWSGVYNGAAHGASGTAIGVLAEDLTGNLSLGASFTDVPGGTAQWTFTGDANYNDNAGSVAIEIARLDIAASVTASHKEYDGTTAAEVTPQYIVVPTDDVFIHYSNASFDDANVGIGKLVTVTGMHLSGSDIGNYNLLNTEATTNADITPRAVTVTADPQTKVYGAVDPELTYAITEGSLVAGDAFTGALAREAGEDVGTYDIVQGSLALTSNYAMTYAGAVFAITPAEGAIELSDLEHVYDGTPKGAHVASEFSYDVTYDGSATEPVNVGEYAVVATITDQNHAGSANGTLVIKRAPLSVTADDQSILFGETPVFTFTIDGFAAGEDESVIDVPPTCGVEGDHSAIGTYDIACSGALDDNYAFNYTNGTLTISSDPNNEPPIAEGQNLTIEQGAATAITLVGNDPENAPLTWVIGTPAHGLLSGNAPNLTYTPESSFVGVDSFIFSVRDGNSSSADATVTITVQMLATCPAGFSLVGEECIADGPIGACEEGFHYNGTSCEPQSQTPHCEEGTLENGMCVFEGVPVGEPMCPQGGEFVGGDTDQCMIVGPIDPFDSEGNPPVTFYDPTCEEGSFDPDDDRCEVTPDPISACPNDFTYENGECISNAAMMTPACPSGTSGTVEGGNCLPDPQEPSCPSGFEREGRVCVESNDPETPVCDEGFHPAGDQCIADDTHAEEQSENQGGASNDNSSNGSSGSSNSGGGGSGSRRYVSPTLSTTTSQGRVLGTSTSCYQFSRTLVRGMSGADVMELQKVLAAKGHMTVVANGYFGPSTEAGVKAFQKVSGLEQVGIVGPKTRALLNACGGSANPNQEHIAELLKKLSALLERIRALQVAQSN